MKKRKMILSAGISLAVVLAAVAADTCYTIDDEDDCPANAAGSPPLFCADAPAGTGWSCSTTDSVEQYIAESTPHNPGGSGDVKQTSRQCREFSICSKTGESNVNCYGSGYGGNKDFNNGGCDTSG